MLLAQAITRLFSQLVLPVAFGLSSTQVAPLGMSLLVPVAWLKMPFLTL